jgi:hypothetical protein
MSSFTARDALDLDAELRPLLDCEQLERLAEHSEDLTEELLRCAAMLSEADDDRHARWLRTRCCTLHDEHHALEQRIEAALELVTRRELQMDQTHPALLFPEPPVSSWM